jgi:hypothetical protein
MALQRTVNDDEYGKLEPTKQGAYVKNGDGTWHLDVDEPPAPKKEPPKVDKAFEALKQEKKTLQEKVEAEEQWWKDVGMSREEIAALKEERRKVQEKELLDKGEVDTLLKQREEAATKKMREEHEKREKELRDKTDALTLELHKEKIDGQITAGCVKHGVRPSAVADVLARARLVYSINEKGEVEAHGSEGPLFGKDGGVLPFDEWFAELAGSAEHLFTPNDGSGAANPAARGAAAGRNVRRSQLSAKQKSDLITEMGDDEYQKLPW